MQEEFSVRLSRLRPFANVATATKNGPAPARPWYSPTKKPPLSGSAAQIEWARGDLLHVGQALATVRRQCNPIMGHECQRLGRASGKAVVGYRHLAVIVDGDRGNKGLCSRTVDTRTGSLQVRPLSIDFASTILLRSVVSKSGCSDCVDRTCAGPRIHSDVCETVACAHHGACLRVLHTGHRGGCQGSGFRPSQSAVDRTDQGNAVMPWVVGSVVQTQLVKHIDQVSVGHDHNLVRRRLDPNRRFVDGTRCAPAFASVGGTTKEDGTRRLACGCRSRCRSHAGSAVC